MMKKGLAFLDIPQGSRHKKNGFNFNSRVQKRIFELSFKKNQISFS